MTSATENLTSLEVAILRELNCRAAFDAVSIPALVEDHGVEVKTALVSLSRKGLVDLIELGQPLSWHAKEAGVSEEQFESMCLPAVNNLFVEVELHREQSFDF